MRRKSIVALVVMALALGAMSLPLVAQEEVLYYTTPEVYQEATGLTIDKFSEAPALRTMVAAGELPPVEKRLPKDFEVINVMDEIGQYGGTLYVGVINPSAWNDFDVITGSWGGICRPSLDLASIEPSVAKRFEYSEDMKVLTLYLREGMKWSDGFPFTADDLVFMWEDWAQNEEINPSKSTWWGGKVYQVEKVDDYTVNLYLTEPQPSLVPTMSTWPVHGTWWKPAHYLKQFHIKYNPEADKLAKEEGYESWVQRFKHYADQYIRTKNNPDLPSLRPWTLTEVTSTYLMAERNPYFYQVDTAGNQLPYIDRVVAYIIPDSETLVLKTIAGDLGLAIRDTDLANYPLYKANEATGGYRTLLAEGEFPSACVYGFNQTYEDDLVLRDIFRDIRFRQAMSLAINRQEISDDLYFGEVQPRQFTIHPGASFYEERWDKVYAEYDPQEANSLLDEMGLKWDKDHNYRLRPDGKTLSLVVPVVVGAGWPTMPISEIVREYWQDVGVEVMLKPIDRESWTAQVRANKVQVNTYHSARTGEQEAHSLVTALVNGDVYNSWGSLWMNWYRTGGESGEEPPPVMKELIELAEEWQTKYPGTEEYEQLAKKIFDIHAENLFLIGTVGPVPQVMIVDADLRNIPDMKGRMMGAQTGFLVRLAHAQWFLETD